MDKQTLKEVAAIVMNTAWDHNVEYSECEMCGVHGYCVDCGEKYVDRSHVTQMIVEALEDKYLEE